MTEPLADNIWTSSCFSGAQCKVSWLGVRKSVDTEGYLQNKNNIFDLEVSERFFKCLWAS